MGPALAVWGPLLENGPGFGGVMKKILAVVAVLLALAVLLEASYSLIFEKSFFRSLLYGQSVPAELPRLESGSKPTVAQNTVSEEKIPSDDSTTEDVRLQVAAVRPSAGDYDLVDQRGGYQALPEESRELYADLLRASYSVTVKENKKGFYSTDTVVLEGRQLEEELLQETISALRNDNPQLFWIANVYSYTVTDGGTAVQLYSRIPADQINLMVAELNGAVRKIISGMPQDLTEFDREAYLFEQVASNCSFDQDAAEDASKWKPYTVYGALVEGRAVCEGYSRAMQLLLSYAGMQCRLADGYGEGQMHMWNLVRVDGDWYHLDATWNDGDSMVRYNYFNVTDSVIRLDHEIYTEDLPACGADRWNYFKARGIRISGLDETSVRSAAEQLEQAGERKEASAVFYFEESVDYDEALSKIFHNEPFLLMEMIREANRSLEDCQISTKNIIYTEARASRGVTLRLNYDSKEDKEDVNG